ncbi:MAG: hypothetical protein C0391_03775 [Anaerolinea sp.]|nr:hypothetical protein [Anaerolinea sp.]
MRGSRLVFNLTVHEVEMTPEMVLRAKEAMEYLLELTNEYLSSVRNNDSDPSGNFLESQAIDES